MVSNRGKKLGIIGVLCAALIAFGAYQYYSYETGPIYNFNEKRDMQPIMDIFDKNWYWLIANDDSSPAFMIKYRTPSTNPAYLGKMRIKVLREDDRLAGFITYYQQKTKEWQLLFLAVDNDFRGKGYGAQLAQYAIDDMVAQGAKRIWLCTRLENLPAQRIYTALGFKEFDYSPAGYVYFEYLP